MKPGYKTTEFWGKCIVQAIAVAVLLGLIPAPEQAHAQEIALGLLGAAEAAYTFARGLAKREPAGGSEIVVNPPAPTGFSQN